MTTNAMKPGAPLAGGRRAGLAALARVRPRAYGRTRNFLDGAVTRLSAYLRHGIIGLAETRDAVVRAGTRADVDKLVRELGWRDYYVRLRAALGERVWDDLEAYKTGFAAHAYAQEVPDDVASGTTGAACIDGFTRELADTGYLHNHARMWFASYLVHWRRVRWQAGAAFFLRHLLDGDVASNNLSWQWVASTFSHKPYFFNRDNLERYTGGTYCAACPLAAGGCPFDASYAALAERLFPSGERAVAAIAAPSLRVPADEPFVPRAVPERAIVWHHDESLSRDDAARTFAPGAPAMFVWDAEARRRDPWSAARERFVGEAIAELDLARESRGDTAREVAAFAEERGATAIVAVEPVDPHLRAIARDLAARFDVILVPAPRFAVLDRPVDLRRYSRYWAKAERTAFGTPSQTDLGITTM
jgi:deoxyribodipyrimidine photo-lyase